MLDNFIVAAALAGIGVAVITGIMGCFVVWRRMAYFGDSLAHSAMLGIALGLGFGFAVPVGIMVVATLFALLLFWLQQRAILATDTLLGILAHGSLALAIVLISVLALRVDLHALLFGDILTVTATDIGLIYIGGVIIVGLILWHWDGLLLMALDAEFAQASGVKTQAMQLLLLLLMTLVVAVSVRVIGTLLITSMLIIPAATARLLARSPEAMAGLAVLIGVVAVGLGLSLSLAWDTPTSPTIVVGLAVMFMAVAVISGVLGGRIQGRG